MSIQPPFLVYMYRLPVLSDSLIFAVLKGAVAAGLGSPGERGF